MVDVDEIPEEELGVELDATVDRLIAAKDARDRLADMYVDLDAVADSEIPLAARQQARAAQSEVSDLREYLDDEITRLEERQQAITKRLEQARQ